MENYSSEEELSDKIQERYYLPLVTNFKKIHDSIHGYIWSGPLVICCIIEAGQ